MAGEIRFTRLDNGSSVELAHFPQLSIVIRNWLFATSCERSEVRAMAQNGLPLRISEQRSCCSTLYETRWLP